MKILIIDDEANARILLKNIVKKFYDDSLELFEAKNLKEGVQMIRTYRPQLVFLDVEMPNEQGVQIYKYFEGESINFHLVFTTAYSQYALKAFELNAIDYILKPIRPTRIQQVIEKVKQSEKNNNIQRKLEELKRTLQHDDFNKIGLPVKNGILFTPLSDIIHLEADGSYTNVYQANGETILVSKPLKFFEHILEKGSFYRPHRSHIFNLKFLKEYVRKDGNYAVLENLNVVPISKEKKEEFLEIVTSI